jgi:hypothetical protein
MALSDLGNFWEVKSAQQYQRWLGACLVASYAIVNEDGGTSNHANRLLWANDILGGDAASVRSKVEAHMKYTIASNATLQASPTDVSDNDIQFIVNSQINTFATG